MVLLGNILALIGCVVMILTGIIKRKDHMLMAQGVQFCFQAASNLVLGSIAGFFAGTLSVVRTIVFTKCKVNVWVKLAFIGVQLVFSLYIGADDIYEWIPFISMLAYTWYLDTDSAITFKIVNLIGVTLWTFHDFHYLNYTAFTFDILTFISMVSGIVMLMRDAKKKTSATTENNI